MPKISVLDLVRVSQGSTPAQALSDTLERAQRAERLGYTRYWIAEHHNIAGIASSATSIIIGRLAAGTSSIRVGSGGIMLPNHPSLVVAEQFGTLESLFPGRIDLGLGRAPGTDQRTAMALRRDSFAGDSFIEEVKEVRALFEPVEPGQAVQAIPGAGLRVPLWILGSSTYGAQVAAALGLPYSFASHFAPEMLFDAIQLYRDRFQPSAQLDRPYVMVGVNVVASNSDQEAQRQFTSLQQAFLQILRNERGLLPPPVDTTDLSCSSAERAQVNRMLACSLVGSEAVIREGLRSLASQTGADEVIAVSPMFDQAAGLRSLEILAEAAELSGPPCR
ncbi:LLM class flavin-dependent oxidoreductase [Azohydromonas australica]|uniref:LLM class flavin-dependent oxidoreductase n=1 Tax=Azohydromonas australica TaxID=364039 RepID=UPI00048CE72B|nr:LLM class flavin-dependent oxidoreductase [Azohydromonas australica]